MSEVQTARAPYNFVPFSNKILIPYKNLSELPCQDRYDAGLKTGEIHYSMTAETPVFISNGNKNQPAFFQSCNGKYAIPASSIKGMVRENMQILGLGIVRKDWDLEDVRVQYRNMASGRETVAGSTKEYYGTALRVTTKTKNGAQYSVPENVEAGYLFCQEKGKYLIYPTPGGKYLRISRKSPLVEQFGQNKHARTIDVLYQTNGDIIKNLEKFSPEKQDGMKRGSLLYTGKWISRQPNSLYLFPKSEQNAIPIELKAEDVLAYVEDWENRENNLRGAGYDPEFWKMPQEGESKPVFYCHHEGQCFWGMSLFLRIGYKYSLAKGLPENQLKNQESNGIDYPSAILGFANRDGAAYRSRVSFTNLETEAKPDETELSVVLSGPKPSYYPGYVADGKNYNEDSFQLRGYKQYWLKNPDIQNSAGEATNDKVKTTLRPLPTGTLFTGMIRYQNLSEMELGLLLWCLRLEDGCFQSIGMGKPYGLGRMQLKIDSLREYDVGQLYAADSFAPTAGEEESPERTSERTSERVQKYITLFDKNALAPNDKPGRMHERAEIKDFFYLKSTIRNAEEVRYMDLDEYREIREPLTTVRKIRTDEEKKGEKKKEEKTPETLDDMLAQLQQKNSGVITGNGVKGNTKCRKK